jgi:hypothetical protein
VQVFRPLPGAGLGDERRSRVAGTVLGHELAQERQPQTEQFREESRFDTVDAFVPGGFDEKEQIIELPAGLQDEGFGIRKHDEPPCTRDK